MSERVQDQKPPRGAEAEAWMAEEIQAQEARYKAIVDEMDALEPQREKWYEEFLHIISTKGFNFDNDNRRVIPKDELPTKPDRPDAMRVVW